MVCNFFDIHAIRAANLVLSKRTDFKIVINNINEISYC